MFGWLRKLVEDDRGVGPCPSGLCVWRDAQRMWTLSSRLAKAAVTPVSWSELEQQLREHAVTQSDGYAEGEA